MRKGFYVIRCFDTRIPNQCLWLRNPGIFRTKEEAEEIIRRDCETSNGSILSYADWIEIGEASSDHEDS